MQESYSLGFFFLLSLLLNPHQIVTAEDCVGKLELPVSFSGCQSIQFPNFKVRFTGTSQPNPEVKLLCWNYEVTSSKSQTVFSHCHTGELGGSKEFSIDGKRYIADLDIPVCGALETIGGTMAIWMGHTATHPDYRAGLYDSWAKSCARLNNQKQKQAAVK